MKIKRFLPIGVAAIAGFCAFAHETNVPVAPVGAIATVGVLLLTLQLEDRKFGNWVGAVFGVLKKSDEHHA